jgi:hypothetical protein
VQTEIQDTVLAEKVAVATDETPTNGQSHNGNGHVKSGIKVGEKR